MKRIVYGSLSVLTAIGTVFVAAKAEVFNAENKSSQLSEDIADANVSSNTPGLPGTFSNELGLGSRLDNGPNNGLKADLSAGADNLLQPNPLLGSVAGQGGITPTLKSGQQNSNALKSAGAGNAVLGSTAFNRVTSSNLTPSTASPSQIVSSTPVASTTAPALVASAPAIAAQPASAPTADTPTGAVSVTGMPLTVQASEPSFSSAPTLSGRSTLQAQAAPVDVASLPVEPEAIEPDTKPGLEESALDDTSVETGVADDEEITPGATTTLTPSGTLLPAPGTTVPGTVVPAAPALGAPVPETGLDVVPATEPGIESDALKPEGTTPEADAMDPAMPASEGAADFGETEADMAEDPASLEDAPLEDASDADASLDEMPEAEMPETGGFPEGAVEGELLEEESFGEELPVEDDASADEPFEDSTFEETEPSIENDAIPASPEPITPEAAPLPPADGTLTPGTTGTPEAPMPEAPAMPEVPAAPAAPIEPLPLEPLPPAEDEAFPDEAPSLDNGIESDAAPDDLPVSGSSSDRLIGEGFTPFQLSYLAINGGLRDEGIPGGGLLLNAYDAGDISAEDIVAAGASSKRLGTAADDEAEFTKGVDRFLEIFKRDARSTN
ncbi:MAG: hypothetical protein AAFP03_03550 [Cyanobacteria bacterium J06598_3]